MNKLEGAAERSAPSACLGQSAEGIDLEYEYSRTWCCSSVKEITIRRESDWWVQRKPPVLTERELALVPETFRCFVCCEVKAKKRFGGYLISQRVCSTCYPWVDEQTVGGLVRWDERHKFSRYVREL